MTILDLYKQLAPLASQLLKQVIFLLALLDQTLPSLYPQLFIVYRYFYCKIQVSSEVMIGGVMIRSNKYESNEVINREQTITELKKLARMCK